MKKIYFTIDKTGHLKGYTLTPHPNMDMEEMSTAEIEDDHEVLRNPFIYKYEDGKLIKDVDYQKKLIEKEENKRNKPTDEEMNALALLELGKLVMGGGE